MRRTAPLFRMDPGWLFTVAGLAVMVVSALLPAERDLHDLRQQLAALEMREAFNTQRLEAYDRFMRDLAERDPSLVRRLAASQLNLMPEGEQPLLMATSIEHTVSDWIEATVPEPRFTPIPPLDTLLTRLSDGSRRLWLMGGGAMSVFLGLVMGFGVSPRPSIDLAGAGAGAGLATGARDEMTTGVTEAAEPIAASPAGEAADLIAACEAECAELPFETHDVEHPEATAEAIEHEAFEWPPQQPPFDAAEPDSDAMVDGSIAAAWQGEQPVDDAWLRDHGSD